MATQSVEITAGDVVSADTASTEEVMFLLGFERLCRMLTINCRFLRLFGRLATMTELPEVS